MPQALAEEFKTIPMSPNLGQSLERAHAAAREQSHRFVLLEHLLFALTEDPEASLILQAANVDPAGLGADVSKYIGGLGDDLRTGDGGEARPDPELLRVLQAAASAAQQSKRRQIDGAIVLAAIVGDGKSPAAGLLKSHGMTFEEAIRALQRANTKARLKPLAKAAGTPAPAAAAPAPAPPPPVESRPEPAPLPREEPPLEAEGPAPSELFENEPAAPPAPGATSALEDLVEPVPAAPSRAPSPSPVQSADEILAAARARIQKRTAVLSQAPEAPYFATPPVNEGGPIRRSPERGSTDAVSEAMRELLVSTGAEARPGTSQPSLRESLTGAAAAITLPPTPRETVVPLRPGAMQEPPAPLAMSPAPATPPGPFMQAAMAEAARAASAAPMPPWQGGPGLPPPPQATAMQGTFPAKPGVAPGHGAGPPAGPMDRRRLKRAAAPLPPMPATAKKGAGGERGPLVEAIPRRMRLGTSTEGEVRIAQERIDQLVQALAGRSTPPGYGDPIVMRALTVRLKAQDGGFFIEPLSPETQWVEAVPHGVHVEPLTWRWSVTPREAGRGKLVLQVSMRSIDLDGESEEVGPPDRVVEIKVRSPWVKTLLRRSLVLIGLVAAFVAGKFGSELGPLLWRTIKPMLGL